jgi:hypothetical protein
VGGIVVFVARMGKGVIVAAALSVFSGCQSVGPIAIDAGRDRYNGVIQSTAKVQTLANIVRVYKHEPTSFMDVTEVDTGTSLTGSVTGAVTGIGAKAGTSGGTLAGQVGGVTPGVSYSENPVIRYIPLTGQGLVAQLVQPLSPDAIQDLKDSDWQTVPLINFVVDKIAPDYNQNRTVANIIELLDRLHGVTLAATKSELTPEQSSTANASSGRGGQQGGGTNANRAVQNDSLTLYLRPTSTQSEQDRRLVLQLWSRLVWMYQETQVKFVPQKSARCGQFGLYPKSGNGVRRWNQFLAQHFNVNEAFDCLPNSIELRTTAVVEAAQLRKVKTGMPLLRTYSALGILKNATEEAAPLIDFVSHERYERIRAEPWNLQDLTYPFYTLLSGDGRDNADRETSDDSKLDAWIKNIRRKQDLLVYEPRDGFADLASYSTLNGDLFNRRRFILVIESDEPPPNAYVAYFYQGKWYYIDDYDEVSKLNFDFVSLLLTVMAVPPTTQPLTPTISVGGG